jgi:hypothetical protein
MKWLFIILIFSFYGSNSFKVAYKIDAKSRMYLNGKTNINQYECYCTDNFPSAVITGTETENGTTHFNGAVLSVKTALISCKNKMMNRDMHKALKADEHPYIQITLLDAAILKNSDKLSLNIWYPFTVNVNLSIAGVTKKTQLNVQVNKLSAHLFQLKANKEILMSDFKVKPRTPFNMIKIEDKVTINFDMIVMIAPVD